MPSPSVGTQLAQARLARKLTLQDVTRSTKIQAWVLESMEKDQLLPGMSPVYAKGFITNYAKFLGLDPAPLVARLIPVAAPVEPVAPPKSADLQPAEPTRAQWDSLKETVMLLVRRGGILAVSVAAVVLLVNSRPLKQLAAHKPAKVKAASVSVVKHEVAKPVPPPVQAAVKSVQPLELVITARKQTWISVKADGNLVAQQKLLAGAQETWTARRRFELVVGAPGKVDVALNGHSITPLAMAHHGRLAITHNGVTPLEDEVAAASAR